jgi:CRP/FNR family cyclic AMP-dependent transcriptional regulator
MQKRQGGGATPDKLAFLRDHPVLGALGPDLVARLGAFAVSKRVRRGTRLFAKGDTGTSLIAVRSGTVRISSPSRTGKNAVLNLIGPGGILGEIALLDGGPRTADATALTDCELVVIERRDFLPLVRSRPEVAIKLIELLCARLRNTTEQVEDVIFHDLPARVARTLLRLAKAGGRAQAGAAVEITQLELSQIIGMSRESTNKQLREWGRRGWIRLGRGRIVLLSPEPLARIAAEPGLG